MDVLDVTVDEHVARAENRSLDTVTNLKSSGRTGRFDFVFAPELEPLLAAAAAQGLDKPVFLLSIFQEVLRRYTGQAGVTVRVYSGVTPPYSALLEGNLAVRAMIQNAHKASDSAPADAEFSFTPAKPPELRSALHWSFQSAGPELSGFAEFEAKSWDVAVVEGFAASYQTLLRAALENPDTPIGELEMLPESEVKLIDAWNQTAKEIPSLRVEQLFEQKAAEVPYRSAVTFDGESMTYRALSEAANHFAHELRALGVGPGALVGICMDRCNEMVVALLAVLKAGGAYLPLDPAFPADRIAFMQKDAKPLVVITQSHLRDKFSFKAVHVVVADRNETRWNAVFPPQGPPPVEASLDDLAYVLYTSGSTGKPKGVEITQRALVNLLSAVSPLLPIEERDVFLATSTISFDISVFEIFAPLLAGAQLVVAPRTVTVSGELLADAIRQSGATILQATPSGWRILLEAGWDGQAGLKMLTAGEPLDRTLANRLLERGAGLWNLYGPTEATIYATGCRVAGSGGKMTVGRPLANYKAYVLDAQRKRLPAGAAGELYLGGIGVARGYLNRPDLTREQFIADPFGSGGGTLYRTGDLARFFLNGEIELLGRADNQIKLRGYRIELEEIEGLLDSHPAVKKAIARVVEVGEGDQRLVAYFVPREAARVDSAQLRAFAQSGLPSYMVPSWYLPVESFALTPNGKVDRKALPDLPLRDTVSVDRSIDEEADELQGKVLDCWRSVLNIPNLGADQNFFEAGGHSLLAVRLFSEIESKVGQKLPISLLMEAPTARGFAALIRRMRQQPLRCLVPMQTTGTMPPLYLVHHLLGDVLVYRKLAEEFAPERCVFGIQPPADLTKRPQPYPLEAIAREYVDEILEQQSTGPFHLAGFSSGSVMAYEMARQLTERGHEVGLLALIDGDIRAGQPPIPLPVKCFKIAVRKLLKIVFKFRDEVSEGPKQFFLKRWRYLTLLWQIRRLKKAAGPPGAELTLEQTLWLAESAYRPLPYYGSALLLRFHDEAWKWGPDPLMGWGGLIRGGLEVEDFPGGHITGMSPTIAPRLASKLKVGIVEAEATSFRRQRSEIIWNRIQSLK